MKTYLKLVEDAASDKKQFSSANLSKSSFWLEECISPPVAAVIEKTIDSFRNKEPEYEPLLYDLYLGEAASALDRCLSIRREIQDIEATAISFARQYARFNETVELDKQISDSTNLIKQEQNLKIGFSDAATLIKVDASSQIAGGMKRQSEVVATSHEETANELTRKNTLSAKRWETIELINKAEQTQHSIPGHALNFKERRDRLLKLLDLDLAEAYKKCIASKEGLRVIYSNAPMQPLPTSDSENALDLLLSWIRMQIEFIERQREREVDFDMIIPLVQPTKDRQGATISVGANAAIIKDQANGTFIVDLRGWLDKYFGDAGAGKQRITALRLKAIGASVTTEMTDDKAGRSSIWNLIIFPPTTMRTLNASIQDYLNRPPIILGDVRNSGAERGVSMEDGPQVRNQKIYGEWRVRVMSQVSNGMSSAADRTNMPATDIKIHIRATGIPLNDPTGW